MRLLLTGGAGYIGSIVARRLREAGHDAIVLDDLSTGHRAAVPEADLVVGDCGDRRLIAAIVAQRRIDAAMHFAAAALVGESMQDPGKYYRANLERSLSCLDALRAAGVSRFVYSSTAAVYGDPGANPIEESHPTRPSNPYGESKLAFERALHWYRQAYGTGYMTLRYFNAAGASADGALGEVHTPETHLVPCVLRAALDRSEVQVFGTDFTTPDGTAVRDYVHVEDLAEAHLLALDRLEEHSGAAFNLGNGAGFSVNEVIEAARAVTGRPIASRSAPRRPGDPDRLVASSAAARRHLGWAPRRAGIETILEDAWKFLLSHPRGYSS